MTGEVFRFPHIGLDRAREIAEFPDLHTEADLLAACDTLLKDGTEDDFRTVRALQAAKIIDRLDQINAERRRRARKKRAELVWGFVLMFLVLVGGWTVFGWVLEALGAVAS